MIVFDQKNSARVLAICGPDQRVLLEIDLDTGVATGDVKDASAAGHVFAETLGLITRRPLISGSQELRALPVGTVIRDANGEIGVIGDYADVRWACDTSIEKPSPEPNYPVSIVAAPSNQKKDRQ